MLKLLSPIIKLSKILNIYYAQNKKLEKKHLILYNLRIQRFLQQNKISTLL